MRLPSLLVGLYAFAANAQTATLTHAAVVHESWEASSAVVEHLAVGASVTTSSHHAGYTHVTAADGKTGWLYSRYLSAAGVGNPPAPTPQGSGSSGTTSGLTPVSDIAALAKPTRVEASDPACADVGGNSSVRLDSLTNLFKNRIHDGTYTPVSFQAMLGLPWQGMPTKRYLWKIGDSVRTADYEGAAVSITGYLVAVEPKTGEACNCEKTTSDWVDWHIWIVETKAEADAMTKTNAIVVESTPRVRKEFATRFDLTKLKQWAASHDKVTVSGWLMLDPDHPSDATGTAHKKASRGTIWEIHPVMKIEIVP